MVNIILRYNIFSKILGHSRLLVELDELNRIVPEFLELGNGNLLLAALPTFYVWSHHTHVTGHVIA